MAAVTCAVVRERLEAFVDGELDDGRMAGVRAHLDLCERCRAHHAEASSLPSRLAALRSPDTPPALVHDVLRRVRDTQVGPLRLWSPLAAELLLFCVVLWYGSGVSGLMTFVGRTASDVGALMSWGAGEASMPAPTAEDLFLLLLNGLLVAVTLYHLTLLSRQSRRLS